MAPPNADPVAVRRGLRHNARIDAGGFWVWRHHLGSLGTEHVVLEAVPNEAARRVTEALTTMATIGIGAGPHCNGQVLVTTEMLGFSTWPRPRYAKLYADIRTTMVDAVRCFAGEVASGAYPSSEHWYGWRIR